MSEVLREFQRQRRNLAIVVDEYGHVTGLVTTEDLLEEIVGEIRDEREAPELEGVSRLPDGSYLVDGLVTVRDLRERVGSRWRSRPSTRRSRASSCNGSRRSPGPACRCRRCGYEWTVVDLEGPRIAKVKARRQESRPA